MSKKSKKQADKEFLEKIKTVTVGTGAKLSDTCSECGHSYADHVAVAIGILKTSVEKPKRQSDNEETAFAM